MIEKQESKEVKLPAHYPLSLSFLMPKLRIKYFTCVKDKQILNYVCINKNCEKKGLICSICRSEHPNHQIISLKVLLSELERQMKGEKKGEDGFHEQLLELQNIYKRMLFHLKNCVEQMAEKFREIESSIHEEFNQAKFELLERVELSMKLPSLIEEVFRGKVENRQQFMRDIEVIVGMLRIKQKSLEIREENIQYGQNFGEIVKNLMKVEKNTLENLKMMEKMAIERKIKRYKQYKQIENEGINYKNIIPNFENSYKSKTITLSNNNRVAKQKKNGLGRFIFTNIPISNKQGQKIVFRIKVLNNWVGLGIGLRERIKLLQYRFEYDQIGHGSYLISSNGFSWSHTDAYNNIKDVKYTFSQDDLLELEYKSNKLVFCNRTSNKKYQLAVSLNQEALQDAYFCANLCSEGDSVEIVME